LIAGYGFPYKWNPAHPARVGVLRKDAPGSSIVWCDVVPCYVFHPCNAFETADGNITLDVVAHASMFADSKIGPNSQDSAFERWTIQPAARKVERTVIDAHPQEFPRLDERRVGQPYRYAYTMALKRDDDEQFVSGQCLIKHDLHQGTRSLHDFGPACYPGEFVFVPKTTTATAAEDDGWLMGFVVNMNRNTTDWVILDAANFDGPPQATVTLPHRIPAGFHGNWVAG
jgi:8'-apo-carotenoid 13,14-cleaving dioxygenase